MKLSEALIRHRADIERSLVIGRAKWPKLLKRVRAAEAAREPDFNDEQIWTFLVACGFSIAGQAGVRELSSLFGISHRPAQRIWFEVLPLPPRPREGNTNLDLATGAITRRFDTKSGIRYEPSLGDSICFCEFKWYSDISVATSHDHHRNQLARVIDTAITFTDEHGGVPDRVVVALVTPAAFKKRRPPSRLYQYKWEEYQSPEAVRLDLESGPTQSFIGHDYGALLQRLALKWITYEQLMAHMPESALRAQFIEFAKTHGPILELERSAA